MIPCEETYGNMSGDNNTGADSSTMNVEGTSCETLEEISLEDQSVSSSQDSEDQIFQREIRIFQESFLIISEGSDFSFRSLLDLFFGPLTLWWLCTLRKANSNLTSPLRNGEELQFLEFFILCYFYDCSPGLLCSPDCRDAFIQPIMSLERFLEISNSLRSEIDRIHPAGLDPYFTTAFKYFAALSSCLGGFISFTIDQLRQESAEQSHQHDEQNCLCCGILWEKLIRASLLNAFEVYCILNTIGQSSISESLLFKEFHESLRSEHNFEVFLWQFREEILLKESVFYCRPKVSVNDGLSVGNFSSGRHEYNLRDRFSVLQSEVNDTIRSTNETAKLTCFSFKNGNFLLTEIERLQENCRKAGNNVVDFSLNSIFLNFFGGESIWWSACLQLIDAALVKQNLSPLVDGEGMEFLEYLILSRFYHCHPSSLCSGDLQAAYSTPIMKEERFNEIVSALENSSNEENGYVTSSLSSLSWKIGYSKLMLVVLDIRSLLMNEAIDQNDNNYFDNHQKAPITLWATVKKSIRVALLNIFLLYRAFHGVELLVEDSLMLKSIDQFQDYLRRSHSPEQCLWGLRKEILSMDISSFSPCFESKTTRSYTEDPDNETIGEGMELSNHIQSTSKKRKGKKLHDISTSYEIVPDKDYGNPTNAKNATKSSESSPPKKKKQTAIFPKTEESPSSSSSTTISLLPSSVLPQSPDDQSIASLISSIHSQFSDNPVFSLKRQPRIDWFNTERGNQLRKYPINRSISLATSSSEDSNNKNHKRKKSRKHCLICRCFTETSCEICQVVLCTTDNSCLNLFGPRENNNCFEFFHSSEVITAFF
jgi:hypothetical protein